jgi:hypothetical protein
MRYGRHDRLSQLGSAANALHGVFQCHQDPALRPNARVAKYDYHARLLLSISGNPAQH